MGRPDPEVRDALLAYLRKNYPAMCRQWFEDIEPLEISSGTLKLLVREPVQLKYLQRCCVDQFTEAAQAETGRLLAVRFVGDCAVSWSQTEANAQIVEHKNGESRLPERGIWSADCEMLISPDYSFENFVIGPGNRLAHAAAIAVAKKPAKAYNPFFIHSGVGLGKTHLLQAICQSAMRTHSNLNIFYISCNGFLTQFMDAVQDGVMADFRHRFRSADILIVDDIHDLSRRDRTQEEFFHTFNSLYQSGKQIVLSSDAAPSEIPALEERLVSRFNCGLVAGIDKPSFETRMAIIKSKARLRNLELPDDVASFVASRIDTNIRELEGAVTKIQGLAVLQEQVIDLELAKQAIGQQVGSPRHIGPSIHLILDAVTKFYDLRLADLLSKRKHKSTAWPRQIGMWLARKHTKHSLGEIGNFFGGRHHTTVIHAIQTVEVKRQKDNSFDRELASLQDRLAAPDDEVAQSVAAAS